MSLPLVFRPLAEAEFAEAAVRYERQSAGLGVDFVAKVERALEIICEHPKRYPIVLRDIREAPVKRFPYCVYYRAKSDRVVILHFSFPVFHSSLFLTDRDTPVIPPGHHTPRSPWADLRPAAIPVTVLIAVGCAEVDHADAYSWSGRALV